LVIQFERKIAAADYWPEAIFINIAIAGTIPFRIADM